MLFRSHYKNVSLGNVHTGLIRHASDGKWYLFDGYGPEPGNNVIDVASANLSTLRANVHANNLIVQGNANITGTITNATLQGTKDYIIANTATSGANTINLSNSNYFRHILTGNTTFTFSNAPANGTGQLVSVMVIQSANGGNTVTWSNTIYWAGGSLPPATTNANARDLWTFITYDGGSTYWGTLTIKDAK